MRQPRKFILVALVAACMLMLLTVMSGCRPSDALKEIIYNQNSDVVDYDNELKFYINNDQAELENDLIPSAEVNDTKEVTDEKQNIVVYGSEPNSPDFTAKQSLWSMLPEFEGIEASAKVKFFESDNPNASKQRLKTDHPLDDTDDADDTSWDVEEGSELDDDKEGSAESQTSSNIEADASNSGGNGNANGEGKEKVAGDKSNPLGNVDIDATGDYVEPPKVDSIAAYGDVAVLVQMIGGNGALAAADKTLLSGDFKSKVFTKANIKTGWNNDGSSAGSNLNTKTIINSGAGAILVPSGSYLSSPQKKELNKGGVTVVQVYKMTNSKYIKDNADTIGKMLADSKGIQYNGKTEERASEYRDFFDTTIEEACGAANGGSKTLAAGKKNSVYENKNSHKASYYDYDTSAKFTLLIDDYDTSTRYTASIDGWKPTSNGAALSTVGYSTTPVSFYLQAGGLINNAAYKGSLGNGQVIVWQFNSNIAAFNKGKWTNTDKISKSINMTVALANGWNGSLLTGTYGTGGADPASLTGASNNFGTSAFPVAIAATQQIKEKFIENSKDSDGIYHPFGKMTESSMNKSRCGKYTSGGSPVYSTVGVDGTTQLFSEDGASNNGEISDDSVVVNPHGLFSSWTEGGSPESFLEAAWACDVISDAGYPGGWKQRVKDFYEQFYGGYTPDMDTIKAGIEK